MADAEIIIPAKGLSTVDNLAVDDTLVFTDTENGNALTQVVGTGPAGPNTVTALTQPAGYAPISPAALGAVETDFSPAGLAGASHMRLLPNAGGTNLDSVDPTGLTVFQKKIINVSAVDPLTIRDNTAAGGTASMKFLLPAITELPTFPLLVIGPLLVIDIWYDTVTNLWRIV